MLIKDRSSLSVFAAIYTCHSFGQELGPGTEILAIIDYAKNNTVANLQHEKAQGWIDREAVFGERSW